ncbi:MAG: hypothetical protein ACYDC1_21865 [Limisphaerales bacterium]
MSSLEKKAVSISFRPNLRNLELLREIEALTMSSPSRILDEALTLGLPLVAARFLAVFDNTQTRDNLRRLLESQGDSRATVSPPSSSPAVADIVARGAGGGLAGKPGHARKKAS